MAKVAERPVDRERPGWMPGTAGQRGSEDERHHCQAAQGRDQPH